MRLLDRLIPEKNGPYILILWTAFAQDADTVESQVFSQLTLSRRPLAVIRLEKTSYFESYNDTSEKDSLILEINTALKSRFSQKDLNEINQVIDSEWNSLSVYKLKPGAIEKILKELNGQLKGIADSFQLFTVWEGMINKASGETVENYSSLHEINDHWTVNLKNSIFRMAWAQLGQNTKKADSEEILKNALRTMNSTFLDVAENHCQEFPGLSNEIQFNKNHILFIKKIKGIEYKIKWITTSDKYQLYVNDALVPSGSKGLSFDQIRQKGRNPAEIDDLKNLVDHYASVTPSINSKLLIDTNAPDHVQPGNVYCKDVSAWKRRQTLLKNYYKDNPGKAIVINKQGQFLLSNQEIKKFKFIELEVTPVCDFAQDKWVKYRMLPGIMIPEKYDKERKDGDNFFATIPIVKINGENYKMIFDFRLLKSIDKSGHNLPKPSFRLRNELSASILSRLSSHASRIGITFVE